MKASEIRQLGLDEIKQKIQDLKHELFNLRFQKGIGQLENPRKLNSNRTDIARLKTVLTEMARKLKTTEN
jgi:large subunit ribosomal protein L29